MPKLGNQIKPIMSDLTKILIAGGLILALVLFAKLVNKRHQNKKKRKNR